MPMDVPLINAEIPRLPVLTEIQKQAIHHTVCEVVAATVLNRPVANLDPEMNGVSSENVMGCFVTLKRQGHLRGCCGSVRQPGSLFRVLCEIAATTATQDVRMPAVSPVELEFLDVTVSLLYGFRPLTSKGVGRSADVAVGIHGLSIQCGSKTGLLLPEVAVEHGLDATAFLGQVCRKAGVSADAWQNDATRILTFQTHVVQAPLASGLLTDDALSLTPIANPSQMKSLAQLCHENLLALVSGATPSYYFPGCPDGTVHGIAIHWGEMSTAPSGVGTISLRPGIPLQSTLFRLCESAAKVCAAEQETVDRIRNFAVNVTVLSDSAVHGNFAKHDLRGFDTSCRACMVMESGKMAWRYDPQQSPVELLAYTVEQLQIQNPNAAQVISLAAQSSCSSASFSNVTVPQLGATVRTPAVSGTFYPADPSELRQMVGGLLQQHTGVAEDCSAVMVPHAGLRYSGGIAAAVFRRVKIPDRVILIGPKHTRLGVDWAIAPHDRWSVGDQTLQADLPLARELAEAIPGLQLDAAAHAREHCIEVELPFLAQLASQSRIVGMALGSGDFERCQVFAEGLVRVIGDLQPRPLMVISSDMNHFADDTENRRLDEIALQSMETLDPRHLYDTVAKEQISMCGLIPAVIVMLALQQLGSLGRCERVAYGTSADVSGDTSRVVGYAGMLLG